MSIVPIVWLDRRARAAVRVRTFGVLVRRLIEPSCLLNYGNFLDRKLRGDFRTLFSHDHHFFKAHAPLKRLAVLSLQGEAHARLNCYRKVQGVNS